MKPSIKTKPSTHHMFTPARDLPFGAGHEQAIPFGAGHEQAKHVMDQTPTTYKRKNSDVRKILQKQTLQKYLTSHKSDGCSTSAEPSLHETILSGKDTSRPARSTRKAGQHSDYNNWSIHTLHTAEILQQANVGREEEVRATT